MKPGKTYEHFLDPWWAGKGFGVGGRLDRNVADKSEILGIAFPDLCDRPGLDEALQRVAAQEAIRHDCIATVIETTTLRGLYEVADKYDFSTDAAVAAFQFLKPGPPTPAQASTVGRHCTRTDNDQFRRGRRRGPPEHVHEFIQRTCVRKVG